MAARRRSDITDKQAETYEYLVGFICEHGYQPTHKEIGEYFGVSPGAIRQQLIQLANKGFIEFPDKHQDRCIVLKMVKFTPVWKEGEPEPPAEPVPTHPTSGPEIEKHLVEYFRERKNRPATVREMEVETGYTKTLLYEILNSSERFEGRRAGRATLWSLRKKGR